MPWKIHAKNSSWKYGNTAPSVPLLEADTVQAGASCMKMTTSTLANFALDIFSSIGFQCAKPMQNSVTIAIPLTCIRELNTLLPPSWG